MNLCRQNLKYKTAEMQSSGQNIVKYKRMCNAWNVVLILYKRYTIKTNCFDEKYLAVLVYYYLGTTPVCGIWMTLKVRLSAY